LGQWHPPFRERFGFQIGRNSTDIVMLFMNDQALQRLLSDKFKTAADATL
jgi:lipid-binding SYLF domain-containing protein